MFSSCPIRDLDERPSQIPFQHIPRVVQILLLHWMHVLSKLHAPSGLSAEESIITLPWNSNDFCCAGTWSISWHPGKTNTGQGNTAGTSLKGVLFSDKETFRKHFPPPWRLKCSWAIFPSGNTVLTQSSGGILKTADPNKMWAMTRMLWGPPASVSKTLLRDGKVLMENYALGLLRGNHVKCFWTFVKCFIWQMCINSDCNIF